MTAKILYDRNSSTKNVLDLHWGLDLLLANASASERNGFLREKLAPALSHDDALKISDIHDFETTFAIGNGTITGNWQWLWTYSSVYAQAEKFFSNVSTVYEVDGDLFIDNLNGDAVCGCSNLCGGDVFIGSDQHYSDSLFESVKVLLASPGTTDEQLNAVFRQTQHRNLSTDSGIDAATIPYQLFASHFSGEDILAIMENLRGIDPTLQQQILITIQQYTTPAAREICDQIQSTAHSLHEKFSDQSVSYSECAQLAFALHRYPPEQAERVAETILSFDRQIGPTLDILAGFTPDDMIRILQDADTNATAYRTRWDTYRGWKKGNPKNSITGMTANCAIPDDLKDHVRFIEALLTKDPNLNAAISREFLLAKICIESEGLSQCNEHGLMQVSDDSVFNHYYEKYVKRMGLPKDRKDYRTSIAVAAYYLYDECFGEECNPFASEGVGMACYNRRPDRMKTYVDSQGRASPLPETTLKYVAKSLVLRDAIAATPI